MNLNVSSPQAVPTASPALHAMSNFLAPDIALPVTVAAALTIWLFISRSTTSAKHSFAPGPKPSWLVGHTFQVPTEKSWIYFHSLAMKYGMCRVCCLNMELKVMEL